MCYNSKTTPRNCGEMQVGLNAVVAELIARERERQRERERECEYFLLNVVHDCTTEWCSILPAP